MSEDTGQILSDIEREQLEIYLQSDEEVPRWMLPLLGLVAWAVIASIDLENAWVTIAMGVVAGALYGATLVAQQDRAGFRPRTAAIPEPLRGRANWFLAVGTGVILVGVLVMALGTDSPYRFTIAGGIAFLVIVAGGTWFQRDYRDRAEALARELGIERG